MALGKTIREVESLSYPEVEIWQRYFSQEPFGAWGDEYRHGRLMALIANCHSHKRTFKATEFMHGEEQRAQTDEEKVKIVMQAFDAFKAFQKKKNG